MSSCYILHVRQNLAMWALGQDLFQSEWFQNGSMRLFLFESFHSYKPFLLRKLHISCRAMCVLLFFFFVLRKVGVSLSLNLIGGKKGCVYIIIGRVEWLSQYLAEENIDKMFKPHRQHRIYVKKKNVLFILFIYLYLDFIQTDIKLTVCFFIFLIYLKLSIFLVHALGIYF